MDALGPVVDTVTLNLIAELALTARVAGTEQLAPVGAPVQLREAVPLMPAPPMTSEYMAVPPGATVAEALPDPSPSPNPPLLTTCCRAADTLAAKSVLPEYSAVIEWVPTVRFDMFRFAAQEQHSNPAVTATVPKG